MNRGRRVFLASALLLITAIGGAALVFREAIRERWLIWKVEQGDFEQANEAVRELGRMGSLRAIGPLAGQLGSVPSKTRQPFFDFPEALSALFEIAKARREESLPYLAAAARRDLSETWRDVLRQLARVASGEAESIEIKFPEDEFTHNAYMTIQPWPPPGSAPPLRTPRAGE